MSDTDEHRSPHHSGRRRSDQIFDGLTWGRIARVGAALSVVGGIVVAMFSILASIIVTKPQLDNVEARVQTVESRQKEAESTNRLIVPLAKIQCLNADPFVAGLVGMPCDSLLRGIPADIRSRARSAAR